MDAWQTAQLLRWRQVPDLAIELYDQALPIKQALADLAATDIVGVAFHDHGHTFLKAGEEQQQDRWVKLAGFKQADRLPRMLGQAAGFFPSPVADVLPLVPSPMAATLAGGMLGAGAGYGAGWLLEQALPSDWRRNRLRRTLATLGGVAGAAPGALWGYANARNYGVPGLFSGVPFDTPPDTELPAAFKSAMAAVADIPVDPGYKQALGNTGLFPEPSGVEIDVDAFNDTLWNDPYVANRLPMHMRAAASGLVTGAAHLSDPGGETRIVSPLDVARMAIGMGSGYASGALVGKTLGVLMGMPDPVQQRLKQTGMWAGLLANVVPYAFGG